MLHSFADLVNGVVWPFGWCLIPKFLPLPNASLDMEPLPVDRQTLQETLPSRRAMCRAFLCSPLPPCPYQEESRGN